MEVFPFSGLIGLLEMNFLFGKSYGKCLKYLAFVIAARFVSGILQTCGRSES